MTSPFTTSDVKTIKAVLARQAKRNQQHAELPVDAEDQRENEEIRTDLAVEADQDLDLLVPILTLALTSLGE